MKSMRYKTFTVQKYDEKHGYLGHCCFTNYDKAVACAQKLIADGWLRSRVLGGSDMALIIENRKPA